MSDDSGKAVERVWARVGAAPRSALEQELDPSDLHTLLMAVSKIRASAVTPARLMQRWQQDRFVRPAAADPRRVSRVEARLWELLPDPFVGIELSPVAPLGTCSAMAVVDQHRIVSTIRGTEVVSDPTNVLALEAALRRKRDPTRPVHLAACHRVIRAQPFHGQGLFQHFRVFALASSARDRGSGTTEAAMLASHLRYWLHAAAAVAPGAAVSVEFTPFDAPVVQERFRDTVLADLQPLPPRSQVREDQTRTRARSYYTTGAIRIAFDGDGQGGEIGDGGFTDWTAKLMADNKERCLISCLATERLTAAIA